MATAASQPVKSACVLVVDDEAANVLLLERLLEVSDFTNVVSTTDSSQVVSLCTQHDPDLIVLDLHMPDPDGFEVMGMLTPWINGPTKLPVLVATADVNPETKRRALAAGARDFLTKPLDPSEVVVRIANLLESRLLQLELRDQAKSLELAVEELEAIEPLATAAAFRDDDQAEHALRVARTSALVAESLRLSPETVDLIGRAARLHDIGKIGLPDDVLLAPGRLAPEDAELVKLHAEIGAEILGKSRSRLLTMAAEIARTHHERWDGSGYPQGLSGEQIPVAGRIVALADAFDGLVNPPPGTEPRPVPDAVAEIRRRGGRELDPAVVSAFDALQHEDLADAA
ncbi:MAG: response regulator [Thermoleophilaceae bacterium]|nr:response regulator [Thermoleophilaceae bacterium]